MSTFDVVAIGFQKQQTMTSLLPKKTFSCLCLLVTQSSSGTQVRPWATKIVTEK